MSPWKGKEVAFAWERWLSGAGQERSGLRVSRWEVALGQWDWCSLSAMPQVCLGGVSVPISWEKKKKKRSGAVVKSRFILAPSVSLLRGTRETVIASSWWRDWFRVVVRFWLT